MAILKPTLICNIKNWQSFDKGFEEVNTFFRSGSNVKLGLFKVNIWQDQQSEKCNLISCPKLFTVVFTFFKNIQLLQSSPHINRPFMNDKKNQ